MAENREKNSRNLSKYYMKNPFVSVIVNTVDRPEDLKRCLGAVFSQTYKNFEVVVVNNGKEGETRRLLKTFEKENNKLKVVEDKTKKLSYLFNVGWKNASKESEIFAYCADDTEPKKDWLQNIVTYLTENPDSAVSGPTLATTNPPGEMFALYTMMKKNFILRAILRIYEYFVMEDKTFEPGHWPESGAFTMGAGIPLPHIKSPIEIDLLTSGNMGVTRDAMEKVGGFDENFLFNHADGDLFIRLKRAGYKMIFHPEVTVAHHMRFGPTRFPEIMGRDTAFYYLKDVRPKTLRGWIGAIMNLTVFLTYWVFKAFQQKNLNQLKGISGFIYGIFVFFKTKTLERNRILKKLVVLAGFLLLFGQAIRKLYPFNGMIAFGDAWPMPQNAEQAFGYFKTAWDTHNPGINMPGVTQISFMLAPISLLLKVFSPESLSWLTYIFAPLPLCFISAYWFSGKIVSSKVAKFLSAFIYSVNPITLGEIVGGSVTTLYAHALLLPTIWFLHKGFQKKGLNKSFLLFVVFLTLGYLASDHLLIWIVPLMIAYTVKPVFNKDRKTFVSNIFKSLFAGLSVILLTLPYTFYYLKIALPFLNGGVKPDVLQFLLKNVIDTYNHWGNKQAMRFGANIYENLFGTDYRWARFGFVIPILAFLSIPIHLKEILKKEKRGLLIIFCALGAILTILFIANARGEILNFLARFPFFLRFRNPSRPSLLLAFFYSPMIALTLDKITSLKLSNLLAKLRFVIIFGAFITAAYYAIPFFSGDMTLLRNRGNTYVIPAYYYKVTSFINNQRTSEKDNFRTLWLPWNHEDAEMKLRYLDPLTYSVPINYGAYAETSYLRDMKLVYGAFSKKDPQALDMLADAGVKLLVVNKNIKDPGKIKFEYEYQTPWLSGAPQRYEKILNGKIYAEKLEKIYDKDGVQIYNNLRYSKDEVSQEIAGFAPANGNVNKLQKIKDIAIIISLLSWLTLGAILVKKKL